MASERRTTANGVKTTGIGSVSASVSGDNNRPNNNHNNNVTGRNEESSAVGGSAAAAPGGAAKKQWQWLQWLKIFPPNGRNSASARVVPKSSEVLCWPICSAYEYQLSHPFPSSN